MSSAASRDAGLAHSRATGVELSSAWRMCAMVVFGCWMLFAAPWLLGRVTIPYDAKALFQAQLQFLANAIHAGQSPAWNPHTFVGIPQIADPQSLIFSPAVLIAVLFKTPSFWWLDFYVFALLGLGAAAVLMLFRDRGWHPAGAAVAALCFAFGGSASWRMQHIGQIQSYAFFALTLWLMFRARDRNSYLWGATAGVAAGLMLVQPNQVALLACYALLIIAMVDWLTAYSPIVAFRRDLGPYATAAAVALLITLIPLLLTFAFVSDSNRPTIAYAEAARGSLHPASLLSYFLPNLFGINDATGGYWGPYSEAWNPKELTLSPNMSQLYMGALPCLILIRGLLLRGSLRKPEIAGIAVAALAALIYSLGIFTPFFAIAYDLLPGAALFRRPADATFILGALCGILAGYFVHRHFNGADQQTSSASLQLIAVLIAIVATATAIAIGHGRLSASIWPITASTLMIIIAAVVISIPPARLLATGRLAMFVPALFLAADLVIFNGPSESTGKAADRAQHALKPDTSNETIAFLSKHVRRKSGTPWRDRIEMAGVGFDWQNAAEVHGLDQTLGYNPLRSDLVTRALGAGDYIAGYDQRSFSRLFPSYRCKLADMLGLRFVATPVPVSIVDPRLKNEDLQFVARTADAFIYENPRALPRVLFAEHAVSVDFDRILASGIWPEFNPRQTVLLDRKEKAPYPHHRPPRVMSSPPPLPSLVRPRRPRFPWPEPVDVDGLMSSAPAPSPRKAEPEALIVRYENTRVLIEVTSPRPGYLILNDVWHPWWQATVDGVPAHIHRANVLFRAVAVPAGRHHVRFEFHPLSGAFTELSRKLTPR